MLKKIGFGVAAIAILLPALVSAHCQIPCGIYDDQMRIDMLKEHITTIEKSMTQIGELSAAGEKNYSQIVRWVMNKEDHAKQFMDIVTDYFMAQRIKPADPADEAAYSKYTKKIELLHQMLVYAMKCKQTTDKAHTEELKKLVAVFEKLYMGEHDHK
jgi:nickel superoxide dismutase